MEDHDKTREELIIELAALRRKNAANSSKKTGGHLLNVKKDLELIEKRYRAVLEDQVEFVVRYLPGGVLTYVNDALAQYRGMPPEELTGKSFYQFIFKGDLQALIRKVEALTPGRPSIKLEVRIIHPDGSVRRHQWTHRAFYDISGKIIEYQAVGNDITEQKAAIISLRQQEARFRTLIETAADGFTVLDREGHIIDVNEPYVRRSGYSREELLTMHIRDLDAQENNEDTASRMQRIIAEGSDIFETLHRKKDGTFWYLEVHVSYSHFDNGRFISFYHDLTQRRRNEEALKRSEERFYVAFHSSPIGMLISSQKDDRIIDANDAYCQITGYACEELLNRTPGELGLCVDPADRQRLLDMLQQFGKARGIEIPFRRRGGDKGILQMSVTTIELNHETCYISSAIDITERKKLEQALQESEDKFRALFEYANDMVLVSDPEGRLIDANKRAEELLGYAKSELISMHVSQIHPAEDVDKLTEDFKEMLRTNSGMLFSTAVITKGNKKIYVDISGGPVKYPDGKTVLIGNFRDITKRKQAEDALKESVVTARTLLDTPVAAAFLIDREGICLDSNETFARRFGKKISDIVGKCVWDLFPPEVSERRKAFFAEGLRTKKQVRFEDEREGIWNDIVATPILDSHGEAVKAVVYGFDITERKRIENELKAYRDHLEELVDERTKEIKALHEHLRQSQRLEAVGLLAGGIAHDFGNILTTIRGSLYLMSKGLDKESPLLKYVEQGLLSADKAANLTQGLLAFSRKQIIDLKSWDLNDIIRSAAKIFLQFIGEHIELRIMLTDRKTTVMADRNQIEQILLNLAANARDAMPDGGTLTVETQTFGIDSAFIKEHGYGAIGQYILLTVADTGTGMDEETKGKIFNPFFTTKILDRRPGLGLAVTYGMVKQHGGFIDIDTFPQKGTTIKIYLPLVETAALSIEKLNITPTEGRGETILLAEDDRDVRATLSEVLMISGYEVIEAEDGEDAVRLFKMNKDRVDLALLDVRMPKKTGTEVYNEIVEIKPGTRVLFISGYTDEIISSQRILDEGLNFISKSALPEEILGKIRELLDK